MDALVPIISCLESNKDFVDKIAKGLKRVTLLIVVDTKLKSTSYEATSFLLEAQKTAEELQAILKSKKKSCEIIVEWGELFNKIDRTARLKKIKKIFILEIENEYVKEVIRELKNRPDYHVELVKGIAKK